MNTITPTPRKDGRPKRRPPILTGQAAQDAISELHDAQERRMPRLNARLAHYCRQHHRSRSAFIAHMESEKREQYPSHALRKLCLERYRLNKYIGCAYVDLPNRYYPSNKIAEELEGEEHGWEDYFADLRLHLRRQRNQVQNQIDRLVAEEDQRVGLRHKNRLRNAANAEVFAYRYEKQLAQQKAAKAKKNQTEESWLD